MKKILPFIIILTLLLAACGQQESSSNIDENQEPKLKENETAVEKEEEQSEEELEEPEKEEEPELPEYVYPLTGLPAEEPVDNRIVAVMINNLDPARPQSGLLEADIVYEFLAEGPITRFLALYQSQRPEVVGPVRSAREYFIETAKGHGAIYVYHGAATYLEMKLKQGWVDNLNGAYYDNDRHLFKRENFRVAPHNSYLLFDGVYDVAEQRGYEIKKEHASLPFLTESEISSMEGEPAESVTITYYSSPLEEVRFEYDPQREKYVRYNDGDKTVDLETKEEITVDNIFIVETSHRVIDDKLRRAIDLTSGGKGYLIHKGMVKEVEWKNTDGRILPYLNDQPAGFVPGKTWINVIPESPGIAESVKIDG
ncbi:MAG: DUF3048 domain-containing protein [Bacillaceae bacterium]|nr:DUF3048 domain-containing protein [Bacillaceae bacterium]